DLDAARVRGRGLRGGGGGRGGRFGGLGGRGRCPGEGAGRRDGDGGVSDETCVHEEEDSLIGRGSAGAADGVVRGGGMAGWLRSRSGCDVEVTTGVERDLFRGPVQWFGGDQRGGECRGECGGRGGGEPGLPVRLARVSAPGAPDRAVGTGGGVPVAYATKAVR